MHRHRDAKTAALRELPLFSTANPRDLRELATAGDEVAIPRGHVLQRAGRTPGESLLLVSGSVDVVVGGAVVATFGPGHLVGARDALDGEVANADTVAASDVTALAITPTRLRGLVETNHIVRTAVFRQLAASGRELDRLLATA